MDFIILWASFFFIVLIAASSPGPDFIVVIRNSVLHSQKSGLFTTLGIALGNACHAAYCVFGIAALIANSPHLFDLVKYIGAAYLVFIGLKALQSKGYKDKKIIKDEEGDTRIDIPASKAFKMGLLTNLLNPKATVFYLSVFPQFASGKNFTETAILGIVPPIVALVWFAPVSILLNRRPIRRQFMDKAQWIDRICGGLLIALGVRLAISKV
ncbi:MAG: LysE family translocator [Alphaproteobacteria bacterium]